MNHRSCSRGLYQSNTSQTSIFCSDAIYTILSMPQCNFHPLFIFVVQSLRFTSIYSISGCLVCIWAPKSTCTLAFEDRHPVSLSGKSLERGFLELQVNSTVRCAIKAFITVLSITCKSHKLNSMLELWTHEMTSWKWSNLTRCVVSFWTKGCHISVCVFFVHSFQMQR